VSLADIGDVVAVTSRTLTSNEILEVNALSAFYTSYTVQK